MSMEKLPLLVLETICEYLAECEPKRSSLLAFASTSRTCRDAARRELFSRVRLQTAEEEQLQQDLTRVEHFFETSNSRTHVRILKIEGKPHTYRFDEASEEDQNPDQEPEDAFSIFPKPDLTYRPFPVWKPWDRREEARQDDFWKPLAMFVSGLAGLKDLIWASTEPVPRCLLSTLHSQLPKCRLHVHRFDLRSLHRRDGLLRNIDDTEYMLATSPSLYSIIAPYGVYDPRTDAANYNEEAILQMTAGLAPNLKHVRMWRYIRPSSGELRTTWTVPVRLPWRGFYPQSEDKSPDTTRTKGKIESLRIDPYGSVDESQITAWETSTDLSYLRSLKLTRQVDLNVLRKLAELAERGTFVRLETLDLPAVEYRDEFRDEIDAAMDLLLSSLPPLESLTLEAVGDAPFDAILDKHGASLQILHLKDVTLTSNHITQLQYCCPNVVELNIEILRTAGDGIEVQIYRTLGAMRSLEKLTLGLRCTAYRYSAGPDDFVLRMGPSCDVEEEEAMSLSMREVFLNAAVDETLARSIFSGILATQASARAPLPSRLSYIKLWVRGVPELNGQLMNQDFNAILCWIGRWWTCRRDARDTHQTSLSIAESPSRQKRRLETEQQVDDDMDDLNLSEQYGDVWRELWPETGKGWKNEWTSFPLASSM